MKKPARKPARKSNGGAVPLNRPSHGIRLAREQCYICWMTRPENPPKMRMSAERMRKIHHDYLVDLERKGILFGAGPFVDEKGVRHGMGVLIIRAKSTAAAKRIAAQEPYTKAGQRVMTITPWQRNEGVVNLSINFADGKLTVDNRSWTLTPAD